MAGFRRDDYHDPEGFTVQLGAVLQEYPAWVIERVTDPRTGLQRTCKFPPSIAEVVEACETLYAPTRYAEQWDERAREQREEIERQRALAAPVQQRVPRGRIIGWREAEAMREANPEIAIIGPFDDGRKIPYRGSHDDHRRRDD